MWHTSYRGVVRIVMILSVVLGLLPMAGAESTSSPRCIRVSGSYEEQAVTGGCGSPVALCTESQYQGQIVADGFFTASSIVPTADTPVTGVVFATGETTLTDVRVSGKHGSLTIKNAAVFHTAGDGELLDVQTIVGGTDDLAGASGVIRSVGSFVNGAGRSTFEGSICLP